MNRTRSAPGINRTDNLRLNPESSHITILISLNVVRSLKSIKFSSFSNSTLYLLRQSSHILLTTPVGYAYLSGTKTDSRPGTVHGNITTTNDNHSLAAEIRKIIVTDTL